MSAEPGAGPAVATPPPPAAGAMPEADRGGRWFLALFALAAVATFLQSAGLFLEPPLYCEDSRFFTHFYQHRGVGEIYWFYNGYVSLLPNLVSFATRFFPTRHAGHVLSGWALVVGAVAYSLVALPRFRAIIASDRARFVIGALLVLWPLGDFALAHAGVYSCWHLLLIVTLLALAPTGVNRRREVALVAFQLACIWSHPLSILVVPLWLVRLGRDRGRFARACTVLLIVGAVSYQMFGVRHAGVSRDYGEMARRTGYLVLARTVVESLAGPKLTTALQRHHTKRAVTLVAFSILGLLGVAGILGRRRFVRADAWFLASCAYAIVALTMLSVMSRALVSSADHWAGRYYYLQQYLMLLALALVAHRLGAGWRWTWPRLGLAVAPVVLWCGFLLYYGRYAWWAPAANDGAKVADFLRSVQAAERRRPRVRAKVRLERLWAMEVEVK